jgi:hypothetical protein
LQQNGGDHMKKARLKMRTARSGFGLDLQQRWTLTEARMVIENYR